jgi:hypothetical protein
MKRVDIAGATYGDASPWGQYAVVISGSHVETDAGRVELPGENLLYLRAQWLPHRRDLCAVGNATDTGWWHNGRNWAACEGVAGTHPGAFDGESVLFCRGGDRCDRIWFHGQSVQNFPLITGAQGIRWVRPDRVIVTVDATYADPSRGLWGYTDYGDVAFGEGDDAAGGGCLVRFANDGLLRQIVPGVVRFVRVQRDGNHIGIACARFDTREVVVVWASLDELRAIPPFVAPPPIDPPVPPVEPPMPETPNHLPTVETVRAQYPSDGNLGNERAFRTTNEVAWIHRTEGFGLRKKPAGNNYLGYAVDIVFHKPSNQFVDVLGSSETWGYPQWSHADGAIPSEWAPPLDPLTLAPPVEPPVDPPVDPPASGLDARVLAVEEDLMRLREALTSWIIK